MNPIAISNRQYSLPVAGVNQNFKRSSATLLMGAGFDRSENSEKPLSKRVLIGLLMAFYLPLGFGGTMGWKIAQLESSLSTAVEKIQTTVKELQTAVKELETDLREEEIAAKKLKKQLNKTLSLLG